MIVLGVVMLDANVPHFRTFKCSWSDSSGRYSRTISWQSDCTEQVQSILKTTASRNYSSPTAVCSLDGSRWPSSGHKVTILHKKIGSFGVVDVKLQHDAASVGPRWNLKPGSGWKNTSWLMKATTNTCRNVLALNPKPLDWTEQERLRNNIKRTFRNCVLHMYV